MPEIHDLIEKLDFDQLHDDAVAQERIGECPSCEFHGDTAPKLLCWCGVCLKYCHSDYSHELLDLSDRLP